MRIRRRKGNFLIVLTLFTFLSVTFAAVTISGSARRESMRNKAVNAGAMDSYIAISNLCADYFAEDFGSRGVNVVIADVSYVGDLGDPEVVKERAYSVFETGLGIMQNGTDGGSDGLMLEKGSGNEWVYVLTDPRAVIGASGITDETTQAYLMDLLQHASVRIIVDQDLGVTRKAEDSLTMTSGDVVTVSDIAYRVILRCGLVQVTQEYVLSGEKAFAVYDNGSPYAVVTIDNSIAENALQEQAVETKKAVIGE